jgi:DnaK suppressor protein
MAKANPVAAAKSGSAVRKLTNIPIAIKGKTTSTPTESQSAARAEAKAEAREARNGVSIAAPVPTDGKPAKNQAGLRSSELEGYRDTLLAKRRELVGDMSHMESEALQRGGGSNLSNLPIHMADMGTDNYEQEFTLGLMEKDRKLPREINDALAKIQNGTFGLCEATHKPIGKPRLEAQPWARFSIEHARKLEKRLGH